MTMDATESGSATRTARAAAERVSLSKWVNEKSPALDQILSAHDVARLTRRCCWVVRALALLGRFPKQQRFHGRAIGWAKRDMLNCLSRDPAPQRPFMHQRRFTRQRRSTRKRHQASSCLLMQQMLPMHFPRTRRWREPLRIATQRR